MDIYIIKFSVCLALFVVFYKLFLENQTMHLFKRFYLLFVLVFAFSVPFITFIDYVEPTYYVETVKTSFEPIYETRIVEATKVDYIPIILWSLYGLGVLLFSAKFILNLVHIFNKIRKNETHNSQSFIYVLLNDLVIPHSFFKYIFLNKQAFKTQQIPQEILIHEQTHVSQKHSLDVLALELMQIVFWFHPLIYILKHAIKLNHEFLADEAVIHQGAEPSAYQKLIITFSNPDTNRDASKNQLASAINYSSIKKRLTVMKTNTSQRNIWLRSIVLIPLIAFSIYGFSERKEVLIERQIIESIDLYLNEKGELLLDDKIILFSDIEKMYQQNMALMVSIRTYPGVTEEEKTALMSKIRAIGIKKFSICTNGTIVPDLFEPGQDKSKSENQGYKDINGKKVYVIENGNWSEVESHLEERSQEKATLEEVTEYNKMAKHINSQNPNETIIKQKDFERMEYLYKKISAEQRKNAESFPKLVPPPPPAPTQKKQNPPTQKEIDAYNTWAKKIHSESTTTISGNATLLPIVDEQDLIKFSEIYNRMSLQQKNQYVKFPFPGLNVKENEQNFPLVPPPPPPPAPVAPLDHVIEMAKKGATFYYEGKSISSDKAIELLKKNKELNISTKEINSKAPKVYISEKPIVIKN